VSYGFLPEAEIEYLQAVKFYEDRRPGLGARLIKEFERTIQLPLSGLSRGRWFRRVVFAALIWRGFRTRFSFGSSRPVACKSQRSHTIADVLGYWLSRTAP
jgi:hypothetical protein